MRMSARQARMNESGGHRIVGWRIWEMWKPIGYMGALCLVFIGELVLFALLGLK